MNVYKMQSLIAFVVFPMVISTPLNIRQDEKKVIDIRLVEELTDARTKRSISESNLPDKLVFDIPTLKGDARLTLKRRSLLPLYDGDGLVSSTVMDDGVFVDQSMHSAMIVKREGNEYKLKGIFNHEGQYWDLKPLERKTRSAETHQVGPLQAEDESKTTFTFDGDQISPNGDPVFGDEQDVTDDTTGNISDPQNAYYNHVIEMAFVVDRDNFLQFYNMFSIEADAQLRLWYTYVAESINIRYQTIDHYWISIKTKVTHLQVLRRSSENEFIENVRNDTTGMLVGIDILEAFRDWVNHDGGIDDRPLPTSDHYMLFTGAELENNILGIAYIRALCSNSSLSVVKSSFHGHLGLVAAHELGHSLASYHDSDSYCDDSDQYIMAASISFPYSWNEGNQWRFSTCSINSFRNFLSSVTCSRYWNTNGIDVLPPPKDGSRAGEVLSPDEQCKRYFMNASSSHCMNLQLRNGFSELCGGMYCYIPDRPGWCRKIIPQEFTDCGYYTNQWCVLGSCVDDNTMTTSMTTEERTRTTRPTTTPTTTATTTQTTTTQPAYRNPYLKCAIHLFAHDWDQWLVCLRTVWLDQLKNLLKHL